MRAPAHPISPEYRPPSVAPERVLWQRVVLMAVCNAHGLEISAGPRRLIIDQADSWLRGDSEDFREVCANAGLDPDFIRSAYVEGRIDPVLLRQKTKRMTT